MEFIAVTSFKPLISKELFLAIAIAVFLGSMALLIFANTREQTPSPTKAEALQSSDKVPKNQTMRVSVIVHNASVPQMDKTFSGILSGISKADPYVELYVMDITGRRSIGKSHVLKNTMAPKWNYLYDHNMVILRESVLDFEIYDWDRFGRNEWLGKVYILMTNVVEDGLNGVVIQKEYEKGHYLWITIHW